MTLRIVLTAIAICFGTLPTAASDDFDRVNYEALVEKIEVASEHESVGRKRQILFPENCVIEVRESYYRRDKTTPFQVAMQRAIVSDLDPLKSSTHGGSLVLRTRNKADAVDESLRVFETPGLVDFSDETRFAVAQNGGSCDAVSCSAAPQKAKGIFIYMGRKHTSEEIEKMMRMINDVIALCSKAEH